MPLELDLTNRPSFSSKRRARLRVAGWLGIYALVLIFGGLFAHQGLSIGATLGSVTAGIFVLVGAYGVYCEQRSAIMVNFIFIAALSLFFVYRLFLIKKFYPPGLLLLMSLFLLLNLRSFKI